MDIRRRLRDQRHARLLARARQGDGGAFRRLYRELCDPLASYLAARLRQPEEVEDLVGAVMHRFLERLDRFDPRRGSVLSWLLAMAHHALVDHVRARRVRETEPLGGLEERLTAPDTDVLGRLIRDEEAERVWDLLRELTPDTRRLFELRFGQDLRYRDIAELTGMSEDAVKQRFARALRDLRARLAERESRGGEVDYAL
jgi:RNA polymerase sigma-70 factor (ECF subfamily)